MVVINSTSQIANKVQRSKVLQRLKHNKVQSKLSHRLQRKKAESADPSLRETRLKENVPRTIEGTREWFGDEDGDERMMPVRVEMAEGDETGDLDDVKLDMGRLADLFEPYRDPPSLAPVEAGASPEEQPETTPPHHGRVLITTSPRPSEFTLAFIPEVANLFGGKRHADVIPRKTKRFELSRVCRWATERGYGSMVVVSEAHGGRNRSGPTHMTVCQLPYGPTAYFRLTSIVPSKAIPGHAKPTSHAPELVLSNFSTPLGLSIGTLLQSVFPPLPELEGRQVVSVQNQRDFIFFRRFRYMFAEREKMFLKSGDETIRARLQEIGPRFTLKIRWLKRGTLAGGLNQNVNPGEQGRERKIGELERQREASRAGRRKNAPSRADESGSANPLGCTGMSQSNSQTPGPSFLVIDPKAAAKDQLHSTTNTDEKQKTQLTCQSKRKRKSRTSAGVQEKFLRGDRSDSEDPETSTKPRKNGGLAAYMNKVNERAAKGRNASRELEWEWKPSMSVSRRKFVL